MSKLIISQLQNGSGGTALTIPAADGTANKPLKTDGSGQLGFAAFALPAADGTVGQTMATDGSGQLAWATSKIEYSLITASASAVAGSNYMVNTTASVITLTLPASPAANDMVRISDAAGTFSVNNLIMNGNGNNVAGSSTLNIDISRAALSFTYNSSLGWVLV